MNLSEAANKAGVPYPTAARWLQAGIVKADGGGHQSCPWQCGPKQVREFKILAQLREAVSFQKLREAAEFLENLGHNPYSTGRFAVMQDGTLVRIADTGEAMKLIGEDQGQTMLIPIGDDPVDA